MHGAKGGAPDGERNGSYRHGAQTKAMRDQIKEARQVLAKARENLKNW